MASDLFFAEEPSTDTRPVLVAMNNPVSSLPKYALYPLPEGCAGNRLWHMLADAAERDGSSVSKSEYLRAFDRRNVLSQKTWSRRDAVLSGRRLADELTPPSSRSIVVLGIQTLDALGWRTHTRPAWGEWVPSLCERYPRFCLLPHPSGRCREYNDPEMRALAGRRLMELYRGV